MASISGTVTLRPARIGLLVELEKEQLTKSAELATSSWGGAHFPLFDRDAGDPLHIAANLQVDALYSINRVSEYTKSAGFRWLQLESMGPFSESDSSYTSRVLGSDWNLPDRNKEYFLPDWPADDPLDGLFSIWLGRFGESAEEERRKRSYLTCATAIPIGASASIDPLIIDRSPIAHTEREIQYRADHSVAGVVVVDPSSSEDLFTLWNLRASGAWVIPWPVGYEELFIPVLEYWVRSRIDSPRISGWRNGAGESLPPHVSIWHRPSHGHESAMHLATLLRSMEIEIVSGDRPYTLPHRTVDSIETQISRSFQVNIDARAVSATIALPSMPWRDGRRPGRWPGVVAAEVEIYGERGLDPERTSILPRMRQFATLLYNSTIDSTPFRWPTGDGFVYGVQASDETIEIPLFNPLEVVGKIFGEDSWKVDQSDEGRFSTRLADILGGQSTTLASQPAVRTILLRASSSDGGVTFSELERRAIDSRGEWPGSLAYKHDPKSYARNIIYWLLNRKLLLAILPLVCPQCRSQLILEPEELQTDIKCTFCAHEFPVGLSVALEGRKSDWRYQVAGHAPRQRLQGALPVIATGSVLAAIAHGHARSVPQAWGVKVAGPRNMEMDVVALVDPFIPTLVVGEIKSHQTIDENDLDNLEWIQQELRAKGVECFILVATLRENFEPEEVELLRQHCARGIALLRSDYSMAPLAFPLVFTAQELSVDRFSDNHPWKWIDPGRGTSSVARESCHRNLGLIEATVEYDEDNDVTCHLQWNTH
ncbi:MAG: hypothetical protein ACRDSH_05590 [Pseudonocardiaceae bacterium]